MAGVYDYKSTKKKMIKAFAQNSEFRKAGMKICEEATGFATVIEADVKDRLTTISSHTSKAEGLAAQWFPFSEILIDLQADLKKAKRRKAKAEVAELEKKIKISDGQAKKLMKSIEVYLDAIGYFDDEIRGIAKALRKI